MARGAAVALVERRVDLERGDRPRASGKFLFRGDEKLLLRGVSYGPFAQASHGAQFPERDMVRRDFALMRDLGVNCFRTFTPPPEWLLDMAEEHDLWVLVGLPWTQHVCFLDEPAVTEDIRKQIAAGVDSCKQHPAILAFLIGNEIPPDVVRWHQPERVKAFLRELYDLVNDPGEMHNVAEDPANRPVVSALIDRLVDWYRRIPPKGERVPADLSRADLLDWAIAPRNVPQAPKPAEGRSKG